LRRTEPLQALARGAQAGTDLQRLAEIGNRARLVVIGQTASRLALEQFHHPAIAPAARIRPRQLGDLFVCRFASTASRP
jgi:hypothetical protein